MGFEVEKKKKQQELWDLHPESQSKPVRSNTAPKKKSTPPRSSASMQKMPSQRSSASMQKLPSQRQNVSSKSRAFVVIILACMMVFAASFLPAIMNSSKKQAENQPIALTTRLSIIESSIPLPSGMQFDHYERKGLSELLIYVKGNANTTRSDYATSGLFTFRIFDEFTAVTFVETQSGNEYRFER